MTMKFKFKVQQYQTEAVKNTVDAFTGQPYIGKLNYVRDLGKAPRKVAARYEQQVIPGVQAKDQDLELVDNTGFKNAPLVISDTKLLENIKKIQDYNNIRQSSALFNNLGACQLDVEMETGTGKTYVYIKTMFEMNKKYGWAKFIVVVPSVAIREGVKKSFDMTQEHFMEQYGKKARYFIYDSKNLGKIDDFSSSADINVMIINMQAFNTSLKENGRSKEARIIYSERDDFGSRRPIDIIAANNPIIIMDEPQKMGGDATQAALKKFNPLFMLNYSATHRQHHNLIYVLDALDAFQKKLVKKIEVKGLTMHNLKGTSAYLYLDRIELSPTHQPRAWIEHEIKRANGNIKRETHVCDVGYDVYAKSNDLNAYKNFMVSEIDPMNNVVRFTNGTVIEVGVCYGDQNERTLRRIQIREVIKSHLEKEKQLFDKGIKTLTLFFIDEVAKYRVYDDAGNEQKGEYALIFEEEYENLCRIENGLYDANHDYSEYLASIAPETTHNGYFSIDKKGHYVNSDLKRGSDIADDTSAYDLILKNKEQLLSFEEPTRFIFSHSALREGWDNPNIFQICTLKNSDSAIQKRQEVGRGLRLCVDRDGNRMDAETCGSKVHDINQLTVIASESYADFVAGLQDEIKKNLYERPERVTQKYFMDKWVKNPAGKDVQIDIGQATAIYQYLVKNDYIDGDEKVTDTYRTAAENGMLAPMKEELKEIEGGVHQLIQNVYDENAVKNLLSNGAKTKISNSINQKNMEKKEFKELWKRINHKYAYTVSFDSNELIKKAIGAIDKELSVGVLYITVQSSIQDADMEFGKVVQHTEQVPAGDVTEVKYDLVGDIAKATMLTRKTVATILKNIMPQKFAMFKNNPEQFISEVIRLIQEQKATMIVEHISYQTTEYKYDTSIFTANDEREDFNKAFKAQRSVMEYVFTDGKGKGSVEWNFGQELDTHDEVAVYAKLPRGFQIPTPVGNYSPDWAIAFKEGTVKHIYFVAETKGSLSSLQLRPLEKAKIECATKLFQKLSGEDVVYHAVTNYADLLASMNK